MDLPLITARQSRAARSQLAISQNTVARATGVNRSQLALFEVQRYLLPEIALQKLRDYYEQGGYCFGNDSSEITLSDDASVDAKLGEDDAKAWVDEIATNEEIIQTLAQKKVSTHWLSCEPIVTERDEILRRLARNYCLVRAIEGHTVLISVEPDTVGELAAQVLIPKADRNSAPMSFFDELFN